MNGPPNMDAPGGPPRNCAASLESVLSTDVLNARPARLPDYETENRALLAIAQHMAGAPATTYQKLAEVALEICRADSSGVSLVTQERGDVSWPAIAGAWKPYVGGATPRDLGPDGVVLDRHSTQLFAHPERHYPHLIPFSPPIAEGLVTPFYVDGTAVGTVWVIAHDEGRKFDAEDARLIETLGRFAAAAYPLRTALDALEHTLPPLREMNDALLIASVRQHELTEQAQRGAATVREAEERYRSLVGVMSDVAWTADAQGAFETVQPEWSNYTGQTQEELRGFGWVSALHADDRDRIRAEWTTAVATRARYESHGRLWHAASHRYRYFVVHATPLLEPDGSVRGWVGAYTDVDARIAAEEAQRASEDRRRRQLEENLRTEHLIAETLQRSLLPQSIPDIPGVAIGVRYVPARREVEIGGDWYDALELPTAEVGIAMGDVAGSGIRAAAVMGQLRAGFHAYALEGYTPGEALERLNRFIDPGEMATVVYLTFDLATGRARYSNAGHLPPLVIAPDGSAAFLQDGRTAPLGAGPARLYPTAETVLAEGSTIVLYTDGLVEDKHSSVDDGLSNLARLASGHGNGGVQVEDLLDHIVRGRLGDGAPDDDVALLALQPTRLDAAHLRLNLPATPKSVAASRRTLQRWLKIGGAPAEEVFAILVAASEAAGNAIEHAYDAHDARFEIESSRNLDTVTITIRDFGRWRPPRWGARGRGLSLMRSLVDHVEIERSEGGTTVRLRHTLTQRIFT